MKNRYDMLMAKATKIRNKIYAKNTSADVQTEKLRTKIKKIQNEKQVYCENLNNQLVDINSLIMNEQRRIMKDAEIFGTRISEDNDKEEK